jgi:hypothetical protein
MNGLKTITEMLVPICGYMPIVVEKTEKKAKGEARKLNNESEVC